MDKTPFSGPNAPESEPGVFRKLQNITELLLPHSIRGILLLLLLVALAPVLIVQVGIYYQRFEDRRAHELQSNLELARSVSKTFDNYIHDILREELTLGTELTFSPPLSSEQTDRLLLESAQEFRTGLSYSWVNPSGVLLASSMPEARGTDMSDRAFFREIVDGKDWVVSDLLIGEVVNKPIFAVARGVRDERGVLQGVVLAGVDPQQLDEVLTVERQGQGSIAIVDRQGWGVYRYPEIAMTWEQRNWLSIQPEEVLAKSARVWAGEEFTGDAASPFDKQEWMVGLAHIPSTGWLAVASRPKEEVMAPLVQDFLRDSGLILLVAVVAFFAALAVSRTFTAPLSRLRVSVQALGRGEVAEQLSVGGPTELDELAKAFNGMAEKLRDNEEKREEYIAELKQSERVREGLLDQLRRVNEELVVTGIRVREQADEALRKTAQLSALLENVGEGVTIVDAKGRVLLRNRAAQAITGWSDEEIDTIEGYRHLNLTRPDGTPLPIEEWPAWLVRQGQQIVDSEFVMSRPDGSKRRIVVSGSFLQDEEGKTIMTILVSRDVTKLRELERMREEYVHTISHDLRSPLTIVQGHAQLLLRSLGKAKGREQELRSVEAILTGARRMSAMVRDLSDSARLQSGQLLLDRQSVGLNSFLADLLTQATGMMAVERVKLEIPTDLPPVQADVDRLERIVMNLLGNALKYSPPETPVVIEAQRIDDEIVISIADKGLGIAAEDLPHIFDRFFRAKATSGTEGLGLGLYITKMLVEAHGGRIWAESEPGKGSTFCFSLRVEGGGYSV